VDETKEYPGLRKAFESDNTCFRCYYYLKSLNTDRAINDTILSVCLNPDYKWFGEQDFTFSNWFDTAEKTMQGTLIEKSKQTPIGCSAPHWCKTGRILKDL
jgi:hypothetical protein